MNRLKLILLLLAISMGGCLFLGRDCNDEIKSEYRSSDGKYIVTLFERDCGATTNVSTIINIRDSLNRFDSDKSIVFVANGQHKVNIAWKNVDELKIECPSCSHKDIFKLEKKWQDINIVITQK